MRLLLICLLLGGCCTKTLVAPPVFDARLLSECTSLPTTYSFNSFEDALLAKKGETKLYRDCKDRHSGLINSIEEYKKEFKK